QQYEETPYPRWVRIAAMARPSTLDAFLRRQLPWAAPRTIGKPDAVDILIAGCGTGQHAIETAQRFPTGRILAVDLSVASLAYARRQSLALGLAHLRYAQADILELGVLGESFDLIEASGVLHHLADPLAGWRALIAILRGGGIMRLGLYSALARSEIAAVHRFIAERSYSRSPDAVRKFRQDLLRSEPAMALKLSTECRDFFSLSECRDLLFHAQERHFTLPQVKSFLAGHALAFLGFEIEGTVLQRFRRRFADRGALTDLDRWHDFETENPRTFLGMYQFYVQKS
ncbi:MAG: class I SAM-dependent methyltransferase, partial [Alphaproteobacteria bacterium]|nr:class I SAM-dependent methyltransferase [Alphaproteobacteria bacterium]